MKQIRYLCDRVLFLGLFCCAVAGLVWLSMLNQQFSAQQLGLVKHGALPVVSGEHREMAHPLILEQNHDAAFTCRWSIVGNDLVGVLVRLWRSRRRP